MKNHPYDIGLLVNLTTIIVFNTHLITVQVVCLLSTGKLLIKSDIILFFISEFSFFLPFPQHPRIGDIFCLTTAGTQIFVLFFPSDEVQNTPMGARQPNNILRAALLSKYKLDYPICLDNWEN